MILFAPNRGQASQFFQFHFTSKIETSTCTQFFGHISQEFPILQIENPHKTDAYLNSPIPDLTSNPIPIPISNSKSARSVFI